MLDRILAGVVDVKRHERGALFWSFAYFFLILSAYYILRPLRDNAGITGGTRALPWLFTATFFVMLAAAPLYGWVVARLTRRQFIPLVYHFFAANIVVFWLLLTLGIGRQTVYQLFFVWLTVFSLFAVSVFWSYLADLWRSDQGKRLYGFIAAGGSLGALAGPLLTRTLAEPLGPVNLFLVSALLLEAALFCAMRLGKAAEGFCAQTRASPPIIGGSPFDGLTAVLRSRYLGGIAAWVALLSLGGTILYLLQAEVVSAATQDAAERTRIFATIDLWVGALQILLQLAWTGRLIARFGTGPAAAFAPLVFAFGFAVLAAMPALMVVMAFQAGQRVANFAVSNPAREILFTAAEREDKYKAKNVIDGVLFRGADMVSSWLFHLLYTVLGLGAPLLALVMVPVALGWAGLGIALGRMQENRAKAQIPAAAPAAPLPS
jgi:AAA family ATP:ADP antiporter